MPPLVSSQGGQWLSRRHAARLGYRVRSVFTCPHGPRGGRALRPVRRPAGGQRCLRLHGQSVGPGDGDLPPHAAGPHQQSVLITGEARPLPCSDLILLTCQNLCFHTVVVVITTDVKELCIGGTLKI